MTIAEKLTAIAENMKQMIDAGKQAEYDRFWDDYQKNGNPDGYEAAFAGQRWNSENWKPKYPIKLNGKTYLSSYRSMFQYFDRGCSNPPLELPEGTIDFTYGTRMQSMFENSNISLVEMNVIPQGSGTHDMTGAFRSTDITSRRLHTVKLGVSENTTFSQTFTNTSELKNVSFVEGSVIGKNIDFQHSINLTKASIENILAVLSTTTSGLTLTLSKAAVNNAFETATDAADGASSQAWNDLIATRANWTISLI